MKKQLKASVVLSVFLSLLALLALLGPSHPQATVPKNLATISGADSVRVQAKPSTALLGDMLGDLPLTFEQNQGQTHSSVRFLSRGPGYTLFLTANETVMRMKSPTPTARPLFSSAPLPGSSTTLMQPDAGAAGYGNETVVRFNLLRANLNAKIVGLDRQPGLSNYFRGQDSSRWLKDIPSFAKVEYEQVLPGVDLVYYGSQRQLEYDFVVAPGTDPGKIAFGITGGKSHLDGAGNLIVSAGAGDVSFHKPVIYQLSAKGNKELVDGKFVLRAGNVSFAVGDYDSSRTLVIDPVLSFSTYLGGSAEDRAAGIAVDKSGNVYLAGSTESVDFPTKNPIEHHNPGNCSTCHDLFLAKLNPKATALIYSTYIGGSGDDQSINGAIDAGGNLYVVGFTTSSDFPVTAGAFQTIYGGTGSGTTGVTGDGYALKLNAAGNALVYATYIGGAEGDMAEDLALDSAGDVYIAGNTSSSNFPVTTGAFQTTCLIKTTFGVCAAGFLAKLNGTGSALTYATYLVDTNTTNYIDTALGLAIDRQGNAYVAGEMGPGWPTTAGVVQPTCTSSNTCDGWVQGFVAKVNPAGTKLVWSTYLGSTGGGGPSEMESVKLDSSNNVYVTGLFVASSSADFPITGGAAQPTYGGGSGCFAYGCGDTTVSKLNSTATSLVYSTYLGGSGDESPYRLVLDSANNAYVVGETTSTNYPTVAAIQSSYGGGIHDATVTEINPTGSAFLFSTYLGGTGEDVGRGMTVDTSGNMFIVGRTASTNFPTTAGVLQTKCGTDGTCNGGLFDAFAAKISHSADLGVTNQAASTVNKNAPLTYTITASSSGPDLALSAKITDTLPAGTTFSSVSAPSGVTCTHPAIGSTGTVTCTIPSLANGGSVIETLVVTVTANSGTVIKDKASVSWGGFDSKSSNNSATATTTVN